MIDPGLPIEARICRFINNNQTRWKKQWHSTANLILSPEKAWQELEARYLQIRKEVIDGLHLRCKPGFSGTELSFCFETPYDIYQASVIDAIAMNFNMAGLTQGKKVFDFGTGLGEAAFIAACYGAEVCSREINEHLFEGAKILQNVFSDLPGIGKVTIELGNALETDLSGYDYYFAFLPDKLLAEAYDKITAEAREGSVLLIPITNVKPPASWQVNVQMMAYVKQPLG
jgi:hypothetical protein